MDNAEHKLIKLLLKRNFYQENKHRVVREMFPGGLASIYDTLKEGHIRYNRDLKTDELKALHWTLNPTLTRAARNNIHELIFNVDDDETYGEDLGKDVLTHLWRVEVFRQLGEQAIDGMNGKHTTLNGLIRIIESHGEDFLPIEDVVEIDNDLDAIFDAVAARNCWKFNLPALHRRIPGGSGGDFMIIFARPEAGKTAFHVSLSCGPDGFCSQGAKVVLMANEEPGVRTLVRAVSSWTGMTADIIKENINAVRSTWSAIRHNYHVIDNVDMTIERLDAYCKRHKPNILIIDQLDKIHVQGSFARVDQRLREVYRQAREIAKRHDVFVIGISQASAEAEGKTILTYSMMEESKTGKAAEADIILGIGKKSAEEAMGKNDDNDPLRYLTVSKNKINGAHFHSLIVVLEHEISQFHD